MVKKKFILTFLVAFLVFPISYSYSAQLIKDNVPELPQKATEQLIKVGLMTNKPLVTISADSDYEIVDSDNKLIDKFSAFSQVNLTLSQEQILMVNGKAANAISLFIRRVDLDENHSIDVNGHTYRGKLEIHRTHGKNGLTVVNILPLEQYLYGILPKEISPSWPVEALKAQAVASRSYVLNNINKHKDDEFDVCSTSDCQVYGGKDSETSNTTKAVNDTRGIVAVYNGAIAQTYFHGSSGGHTENIENVWNVYKPYLRGVPDYDQDTPYKWEKKFSAIVFTNIIKSAGYKIGYFKNVELSPLITGQDRLDRGVSGRVKSLRVVGNSGKALISGTKLRTLLGLPSTLFDIKVTGGTVVVSGVGSGHGIGLSQMGAKIMAERAYGEGDTFYQSIIKYYYQGVDIKKIY